METACRLLAVIPARGGSKGLPGKNVRPFAGLPLVAHSILYAKLCPEIDRCIVSTDSPEVAEVARRYGGEAPFLRPAEMAQDDSPLWPALRHALAQVEQPDGVRYDTLLLLDPTSPAREPSDVSGALHRLQARPDADGVIGVSQPDFNPIWHCVVERDGWMVDFSDAGARYERRQEVPPVYRINGSLYLWRAAFVRTTSDGSWRERGKHLLYEIPEGRAMSIDTAQQFERAELLVRHGLIHFSWLDSMRNAECGMRI
ncbi:MAG: acylneuraminate cytidylyltransferase family protein [Candidatus Omnitrophica bacterium]|nr:acylneuraminate cytidylyltransferase family protein [Candidatus Omnitrophota bacterium]